MVTAAMVSSRLTGAAVGVLVDRALGEPPARVHPVAVFGRLMQHVEARGYRDERAAGSVYAATGLGVGIVAGLLTRSTATAVACTAAGRMLRTYAHDIQRELERGSLDRARAALPALVGRDPSELDASGIAAAVIESVAENTVDAVVAPALWGAAFGAPGAVGYRAVNTMDAMVGHHSARYERFGWCSARFDDVAAYVPARVTAGLVCLARPSCTGAVRRAVSHDARAHPSPNAGVAEAAFAAALGIEVGGKLRYAERIEDRPLLGTGPRPGPADIGRSTQLASQVELTLAALLGVAGLATWITRRRSR